MEQPDFFKRFKYNPKADLIGGGGFGKVFMAYDDFRDRHVAIKVAEADEEHEQYSLRKEVELCKSLPVNKYIAYYEDCYRFEMPNGVYDYGILQYYPDGNLTQILSANLTLAQKIQLCNGILNGMLFLYENNIIHRDLKSTNILISKKDNELIPKITDFGLSKKAVNIDKSGPSNNSFIGGSIKYSAPEQLLDKKTKGNVDVWSLGVIIYEIFKGRIPFDVFNQGSNSASGRIESINRIVNGDLPDDILTIPQPFQDIIYACLIVDPDLRAQNIHALLKIKESYLIKQNEVKEETFIIAKPRPLSFDSDEKKKLEVADKLEEERLLAEKKKLELEQQRIEQQRIEEEKRLHEERLIAEKKKLELEQQRIEQQRIEEEKRLHEERLIAEKKKLELEQQRIEHQRIEEEKRIHEERLIAEKKKLELEQQRIEQQRIEEEKRLHEERLIAEKKKLELEQQRIEQQRIEEEKRLHEERLTTEKKKLELEQLRIEEEKRLHEERLIAEKKKLELEQQRIEEEKRLHEERLIAEKKKLELEQQRIEQQRIEEEKRLEKERLILVKKEKEKREKEIKAEEAKNKKYKQEKVLVEKNNEIDNNSIITLEEEKKTTSPNLEEKKRKPILIYWLSLAVFFLASIIYFFTKGDNIDPTKDLVKADSTTASITNDLISDSENKARDNEEETFRLASTSNGMKSLESFINSYPKSKYVPEIKKLLQLKIASISSNSDGKEFFDYAEKSNSISVYQAYLSKYPTGTFTLIAKQKIAKLEIQKEEELWTAIKKDNSPSRYEEYLNIYPKGIHSNESINSLNEFKLNNEWVQVKSTKDIEKIKLFINSRGQKFSTDALALIAQLEKELIKTPVNSQQTITDPTKNELTKIENSSLTKEVTKEEETKKEEEIAIPPFILNIEKSFVKVNGGSHSLGCSDGNCGDDAAEEKLVTIKSFSILKTEVTQAMYHEIMGKNPSEFKSCSSCPVENVSFDDALAFITKLNSMKGNPYKYRLPSEAEWEYAASGGNKKQFAGSDEISSVAVYKNNSRRGPEKVTDKKPNAYGIYDMSGNVYEWCDSWYSPNFKEASKKDKKVIRGGSWNSNSDKCKVKVRSSALYNEKSAVIGFRIVRH
jgi:formylglycine-generating enzyme required for sulfatase activity/serine/threonine protein kinase